MQGAGDKLSDGLPVQIGFHVRGEKLQSDHHNPASLARGYPVSCISDLPDIQVNAWINPHYPQRAILLDTITGSILTYAAEGVARRLVRIYTHAPAQS